MAVTFAGKGTPITQAAFDQACTSLGGDAAALWSLLTVETRGFGFLNDRRPKILFERHVFHNRTGGRFSTQHPDISNPTPGGYAGGAGEYPRLEKAMGLDETAALESASWGLGQVMGFNAGSVGFADAAAMVQAMVLGEGSQLGAAAGFITGKAKLLAAFQAHDWATVAATYNGPRYAENGYDTKLASFHQLYQDQAKRPDIPLRTAQACLSYLGFDPHGIDGRLGPGTMAALRAYRTARGLPAGAFDATVLARLTQDAGI
jgi:hypothetical protein